MAGQLARQRDAYRWWLLVTVVFGVFASVLDSTIVNTALPRIQQDFGANLHRASYVVSGYVLAAGVAVPAAGYLANRFGLKRAYLGSLALFTAGSALCGIAPSLGLLIAARLCQGAGGAALFPLAYALLFGAFADAERGKANGLFGIPVLAAPALGPTLGGWIAQYAGWRWVFFVNLPVGLVGVALGLHVLRDAPVRAGVRFDVPGFLLAGSGLGLLLYGLSNLAYDGWASAGTVSAPILVSLPLLGAFVAAAWRGEAPLLRLRLYQRRNYALGAVLSFVGPIAIFGRGFVLPQFLQGLRGQTPAEAGLLLLWQGIGAVLGSIVTSRAYHRLGPRVLLLLGAVDVVLTSGLLVPLMAPTSDLAWLAPLLLASGLGLTVLLQAATTLSLDGIRGPALAEATTLSVVTRNVAVSLFVAGLASFLQARATAHLRAAPGTSARLAHLGVGGFAADRLPLAARAALALAYRDTFVLLTVAVLPALLALWFLHPPGWRHAAPEHRAAATASAELDL